MKVNRPIAPSSEAYAHATKQVREAATDTGLDESILTITPEVERDIALAQFSAINTVLSYSQAGDRIECVPKRSFELGAFAGFLVVRNLYGSDLPASQVFASMAPHVAPPSDGVFGLESTALAPERYRELQTRPELVKDVIAETNKTIRMAGKLGLNLIGAEARDIVELWSLTESEPTDFQHGFGFSIMGAKRAHEYIQRSIEAMTVSDEFKGL